MQSSLTARRGRLPVAPPVRHDRAVSGRIYSVGYEGLAAAALVDRLAGAAVTKLFDVRLNASSRKPGFSGKSLSAALRSAGIEYVHEPDLGNPRENREVFRQGDIDLGRRRMRARLGHSGSEALGRLVDAAHGSRVAVLCVERDQLRCHRHVITDMAVERSQSLEVLQVL